MLKSSFPISVACRALGPASIIVQREREKANIPPENCTDPKVSMLGRGSGCSGLVPEERIWFRNILERQGLHCAL